MITIRKQEIIKLEDVLHLYQASRLDKLYKSTSDIGTGLGPLTGYLFSVWWGEIVCLIRLVGDGFSSVFVQDLIVLSSYQRQGIGSSLMKQALKDYKDTYQVQLVTDQTERTLGFYRSMGFEILSTYNCIGMTWTNREK